MTVDTDVPEPTRGKENTRAGGPTQLTLVRGSYLGSSAQMNSGGACSNPCFDCRRMKWYPAALFTALGASFRVRASEVVPSWYPLEAILVQTVPALLPRVQVATT